MNLANEYLRAIEENDKKSFKDNENYLSSNTYLVISKYFNQKDSINQTLNPKIPKIQEFLEKYSNSIESIDEVTINEASEMIFAQVSPCFRNYNWTDETVPKAIKNAAMEQAIDLLINNDTD